MEQLFLQVRLTWQKRVYDSGPSSSSAPRSRQHDTVELCADRFVSHVPHFQWQKLLTAIREDNEENQLAVLMAANVSMCLAGCFSISVSVRQLSRAVFGGRGRCTSVFGMRGGIRLQFSSFCGLPS